MFQWMKTQRFHINSCKSTILALLLISFVVLFDSCNSTRHVPENSYILSKNKVQTDNNEIIQSEIQNVIRQKPNKRILFYLKPYLWIYNLSNPAKNSKIHQKLREFGEKPVLFDSMLVGKSKEQISIYLRNKGYYQNKVSDTILYKRKRAIVKYMVESGQPMRIDNISYIISNPEIDSLLRLDSLDIPVKKGDVFNLDILQGWQKQIELKLRDQGFFGFHKELVYFIADTSLLKKTVDLTLQISPTPKDTTNFAFRKTKIDKVMVFFDYDKYLQKQTQSINQSEVKQSAEGVEFIYPVGNTIKYPIVASNIFLLPGDLYQIKNEEITYKNLASLQLFKTISISFTKSQKPDSNDVQYIDCRIELSNNTIQNYETNLDLTSSSGFGIGGSINYNHRNLFLGAESFNISIKGSTEAIKKTQQVKFSQIIELGTEAGIVLHRFFLPWTFNRFILKFNPKTVIKTSYTFKQRPEFSQAVITTTMGYTWKTTEYNNYRLNPLEINYVDLIDVTPGYLDSITTPYFRYTFLDHFLIGSGFLYEYNNQLVRKNNSFKYFRWNTEVNGNTLYWIFRMLDNSQKYNFKLFDIVFSQFFKTEIEFRYNQPLNDLDRLVFRYFTGIVKAYGNVLAVPFEKKYFSGGANSMRAWQFWTLGPGSFNDPTVPIRNGDFKIEANIEYRFKIVGKFEGAFFAETGNVWTLNKLKNRSGAHFEFNRFYKELAIGSGIGLRFDFNFAILRSDLGFKIFDPGNIIGDQWFFDKKITYNEDFNLTFGIGFPF